MPRTNLVNAVDDELAAPVAAPDLTIEVVDGTLLPPVPFYLVVDPFNDTQGREYMLCTLVVGTTLTVTRNLAGTDSDVHDTGDIVRITIAAQHIEDIWDSIEAVPPQTFLHDDLTDVTSSQHHPRYIDQEAIDAVGPHFSGDHADLTNVLTDQHHPRYTDAEAIAAVGDPGIGVYLPLAGGVMTGIINAGSFPLVNLLGPTNPTDAANKAYVDSVSVPQTFLHADLTDVGSLPSAHHAKYLDSEAVAAVQAAGVFLPLTGGVLTGPLTAPNYVGEASFNSTEIPLVTVKYTDDVQTWNFVTRGTGAEKPGSYDLYHFDGGSAFSNLFRMTPTLYEIFQNLEVNGQVKIVKAGGAVLVFADSQNFSEIRSEEQEFSSDLVVRIANNERVRWTGGETIYTGEVTWVPVGFGTAISLPTTMRMIFNDDPNARIGWSTFPVGIAIKGGGLGGTVTFGENDYNNGIISANTGPGTPNVFINATSGLMQRSTAILAATTEAAVALLDARTGLTSPPESIDLKALIDYILDRIDALETFHP